MWSHPLSFNLIQPPSSSAPSNNSELPMNCTTIVIDQRVTRHVSIRLSRICSRLYIREHNTRWYRISTRVCCVWPYLNREWLSSTTYVYSFAFIHVYSRLFAHRDSKHEQIVPFLPSFLFPWALSILIVPSLHPSVFI